MAAKGRAAQSTDDREGAVRPGDRVTLIDGSGYIFRAYHALPPLTRKSDGLPVGAIAGFCAMLHKLLEEGKKSERPTHLAVVFDASGHTFRNDLYPEYKAHRPPAPEDLVPQFPLIRDAVRAFNVSSVEMEGFEADDLIATYARQAAKAGAEVTIVSSDKDLMQLVDKRISLYDTMKDKRIGPAEVIEKFGVAPDKVIDVQALAGDSVDNVPGVPGIGIKTAAELINQFGDLETLLKAAETIKQPKRRESLMANSDAARMSRELVTLRTDVPVEQQLSEFAVVHADPKTLVAFLKGLEFNTLTRRIASEHGIDDIDAIAPASVARGVPKPSTASAAEGSAPGGAPGAILDEAAVRKPIDTTAYETIFSLTALDEWIAAARDQGLVVIDTETTSLDAMQADLVGVSLALAPQRACYIPLGHGKGGGLDFDGVNIPKQLAIRDVLDRLTPLLSDPTVLKVGQNLKYDLEVLTRYGIEVAPIDDTMLLSYAVSAGAHGQGMDELAELHLGHKTIHFADLVGTGKGRKTFAEVPIDQATAYSAEDADVTLRLHRILKAELIRARAVTVYETLERPLVPVLVAMERAGVKVDVAILRRLSGEFAQRMAALEAQAHAIAGHPFNLGSPKQISEILFEKGGMAGGRKTKTGAFTTSADVLEEHAAQGHELPQVLLDWRQMSKLKSTYTDALPGFVNPETGRVHTSYAMAATSTGRLASTDPNLQNIPVRSREGREIRKAFIAEKGNVLVSADYSQVELRIFAHMAGIEALKEAFAKGADIHRMTASEMFGIPPDKLDDATRSRAKAINFGIIYGISAFGLANQLRIPREEAQAYIAAYFAKFPGIKDYMEKTKAFAKSHGYVETLFGRRCHMREINSKVPGLRANAERAAINAPIQGTAADIIRRAMIRIHPMLAEKRLAARMLLQIHDELIFECPSGEAEKTCAAVKSVMERASEPAVALSVKLIVEAKAGASWADIH
jgi:DNA polymerase-1